MARVSLPRRRSFLASRHITWTTLRRLELEKDHGKHGAKLKKPTMEEEEEEELADRQLSIDPTSHPTTEKPNPQEPKPT